MSTEAVDVVAVLERLAEQRIAVWIDGAGAWGAYPADGLRGTGCIAGRDVRCLTPELQLRHHLGYPPAGSDRHDLHLLVARFGLSLPTGFGQGWAA